MKYCAFSSESLTKEYCNLESDRKKKKGFDFKFRVDTAGFMLTLHDSVVENGIHSLIRQAK